MYRFALHPTSLNQRHARVSRGILDAFILCSTMTVSRCPVGNTAWTRSIHIIQKTTTGERTTYTKIKSDPSSPSKFIVECEGKGASKARDTLFTMFLPKDLSRTVTKDYLPFISWNLVQSVTGTVTSTLSTQALLLALGMGSASSAGLAGTLNWIIKDGFGLLGGVLFAGFMGNRFDASPKRYRFMSNVLVQGSAVLEMLAPLVPSYFLPLASLSNIGKNIGWLATSATRASIHRGFTKHDNLGDITAKAGAQNTAAGLFGTGLGILVSYFVASSTSTVYLLFGALSLINLGASYMSCRVVVTRNLNIERLTLALRPVFEDLLCAKSHSQCLSLILSPDKVAKSESILLPPHSTLVTSPNRISLQLEPSIQELIPFLSEKDPLSTHSIGFTTSQDLRYRIVVDRVEPRILVWYTDDADTSDIMEALSVGTFLQYAIPHLQSTSSRTDAVQQALELAHLTFVGKHQLKNALEGSGWEVEHHHLADHPARLSIKE